MLYLFLIHWSLSSTSTSLLNTLWLCDHLRWRRLYSLIWVINLDWLTVDMVRVWSLIYIDDPPKLIDSCHLVWWILLLEKVGLRNSVLNWAYSRIWLRTHNSLLYLIGILYNWWLMLYMLVSRGWNLVDDCLCLWHSSYQVLVTLAVLNVPLQRIVILHSLHAWRLDVLFNSILTFFNFLICLM